VELGRHYFWADFPIPPKAFTHGDIAVCNTRASTRRNNDQYYADLKQIHGFDLDFLNLSTPRKCEIMRNCVDYRIGKYILSCIDHRYQTHLFDGTLKDDVKIVEG
jgi:hypothetical protein